MFSAEGYRGLAPRQRCRYVTLPLTQARHMEEDIGQTKGISEILRQGARLMHLRQGLRWCAE
jgi:hypothetical protein